MKNVSITSCLKSNANTRAGPPDKAPQGGGAALMVLPMRTFPAGRFFLLPEAVLRISSEESAVRHLKGSIITLERSI